LRAREAAQQASLGRFSTSRGLQESRDPDVVPRDSAKAARGFEDAIMVHALTHNMDLGFRFKIVAPGREFNPIPGIQCGSQPILRHRAQS
jgi:hypothetical protein